MSYTTIDHLPASAPSLSRRDTLTRNASSIADRPKTSSLTITAITKTISNYFFKPEKLPLAMQERIDTKIVTRPFYSKNRRLISGKVRREEILPNGFKDMLRAKSTVIKQKKLQEFYINREGRQEDVQISHKTEQTYENNGSNLFRSNFPMKKTRHKCAKSGSFERKQEVRINLNNEMIKIPTKAMTIHALTQDINDLALQEKPFFQSHQNRQKEEKARTKINWQNIRKRKRQAIDKQNMEFVIEPWKAAQNDDLFF